VTVIVDATIWIDYLGGASTAQTQWLEEEMDRQRLGILDLILCEVLQGIRDESVYDQTRKALLNYEVYEMGGLQLAVAAAQNYRTLRTKGYTIRKTIDCLIASYCILNGHTLLHSDRDFEPFERYLGLQVIHSS